MPFFIALSLGLLLSLLASPTQAQLLTGAWEEGRRSMEEALYEELAHEGPAHEGPAHEGLAHEGLAHEGLAPEISKEILEPLARSLDEEAVQAVAYGASPELPGSPELPEPGVKPPPPELPEPVDLQADELIHNDEDQLITARGNVRLEQAGRFVQADEIRYDLAQDKVFASGNVMLTDINGDVHLADEVEFQDQLKNGFVKGLRTFLLDGSRFTADGGERQDATKTIMYDARYTPCQACSASDLEENPLWQIRAAKVTHDELERRISYNHARFEVYGVPIAYTPYFSHADGTIDRKSGLLAPSLGYKSDLGAIVENSYYWAIAPDKDATFGLRYYSDENPLAIGEWRQRWESASLFLEGSATSSEREDENDIIHDEEFRGHLFGEALWNIDQNWRAGFDVQYSSDDQYLRQYDFDDEDVLTSQLYAERFSGRNYMIGRLLSFQDVRVREEEVDQPDVLPEIIASFVGEPDSGPLIGGRFALDASFLGLQRSSDEQDMNRASVKGGWFRRFISQFGLIASVDASVQGDLYNVRDRTVAQGGTGRSSDSSEARMFPQIHFQTSYPLVKAGDDYQASVEPIVAVTAGTNIDVNDDIPNEDSQDVQIDASNIFEPSRFPGIDRLEDKARVTYGMRTGFYGHDGSYANIFLGQSYRLDEDDNPFPEGSGLNQQQSDYVGQIAAALKERYSMHYRFQLGSDNFASQRHEIDMAANFGQFYTDSRYLFAKGLEGTDITDSREQIRTDAGYYWDPKWLSRFGATYDLGAQDGLRQAYIGLDFFGECLSWSITGERNLTDDDTGDSSTEVFFRIGLKNLSEFKTSALRRGDSCE